MKKIFSLLPILASVTFSLSAVAAPDSNTDALKVAAFKVIQKRVIERFRPATESDVTILRHEKNGVIDFLFRSKNGTFIGDAFCQYSELLKYSEKYTDPGHACFRINVSEHTVDPDSINGVGKQVGIY